MMSEKEAEAIRRALTGCKIESFVIPKGPEPPPGCVAEHTTWTTEESTATPQEIQHFLRTQDI